MDTRLDQSTFDEIEQRALVATPLKVLTWAWEAFGQRCCVLSSMQDAAVVELAMRVSRDFPVVFLDTGYHFEETWATLRAVESRYGIKVEVHSPETEPQGPIAPGECCDIKPDLLRAALAGRQAWVSGIRRQQTANRSEVSLVERDRRGLSKINPVAQWSDSDHACFLAASGAIRNPLLDQGYTSIGCEPCTSCPDDGSDARSGRWSGQERTECGLHL